MNAERLALVLLSTGIGWYVAVCIGGGALGGWWLDGRTGWSPLLTLLGLGLGLAVALVGMMRMLLSVFAAKAKSDSEIE